MIKELKGTLLNPDKVRGKSAYEIAVMHGFDGTEEEWLDSISEGAISMAQYHAGVAQDQANRAKSEADRSESEADKSKKSAEEAKKARNEAENYTEQHIKSWLSENIDALPQYVVGFVSPEMFGAVGDGSADDTNAVQTALDMGINNIFIHGKYRITGVTIPSNRTIFGNGTIYVDGEAFEGSVNKHGFQIEDVNNVTIRDIVVVSGNSVIKTFYVKNSKNVTIDNVIVTGGAFDGTTPKDGTVCCVEGNNSQNVTITHCNFTGFETKGVEFIGCTGIEVTDCFVAYTGRAGISLYYGNSDAVIRGNTLRYNVINFTVSDGAIDMYHYNDNVLVENNTVSFFGSTTIQACGARFKGGNGCSFIGNTFHSDNEYALCFIMIQPRADYNINDVLIKGNSFIQRSTKLPYAIRVHQLNETLNIENLRIVDNYFNVSTVGISVRNGVNGLTVDKNQFALKSASCNELFFDDKAELYANNVSVTNNIFTAYVAVNFANGFWFANNQLSNNVNIRTVSIRNSQNCIAYGNVGVCRTFDNTTVYIDEATCENYTSKDNVNLNYNP